MRHNLWETGEAGVPPTIQDSNGEVVLGLCKVCGRGEIELDEDGGQCPGTRARTHDRDLGVIHALQRIAPGVEVQLLTRAEPIAVAQLIAGTMDRHIENVADNIDPVSWFGLMSERRQRTAMASVAVIVSELEKAGYVIAKALPGEVG